MQAKLDALSAGKPTATSPGSASVQPASAPVKIVAPTPVAPAAAKPAAPAAKSKPAPAEGSGEARAREALAKAGIDAVTELRLDARRIWVGMGQRKGERLRVAVDRDGTVYARKVSK